MKSVLVCVLLALPLLIQAQNRIPPLDTLPGRPYYILLRDGANLRGRIIRQDTTMLTVKLVNGQRTYVEASLFDRITLTPPPPAETYFETQPDRTRTINPDPARTNGPRRYVFTLLDGTELRGTIVREDSAQTILRTSKLGDVTLRSDQIRRRELLVSGGYNTGPQPRPSGPPRYTFTLLDGTELRGTIVRQDSAQTVLRTLKLGDVVLRAGQIRRQELIGMSTSRNDADPAAESENPTPQWLPAVPTAFTAEPGRLYYRNTALFVNQLEYGLTKNISVGGTVFYAFIVYAASLNLKVTVPVSDRVRLGVSGQLITAGSILPGSIGNGSGSVGILQAFGTGGTPRRNLTLGAGTFINNGSSGGGGFVTVGVMQPLSRNLLIISQNNFLVGGYTSRSYALPGVFSVGLRLIIKQHAFDFLAYTQSVLSGTGFLTSYHLRLPSAGSARRP
jgi:hypothetical protein